MADNRIDKALPNILTDQKIPSPEALEEVDITEIEKKGPVEVPPDEEGGAPIDFDPNNKPNIPGTEEHFDNLADILPDDILDPVGNKLTSDYMDYKLSLIHI